MEADNNGTARAACLRYTECDWGDLIEGTKELLQALGLGIGLAFPGELGGPRRELKVRDPRGYPVRISNRYHNDDRYTAYLSFPNWPDLPDAKRWTPASPGVKKSECNWCDEYLGNADDLAAAGLVRVDQLPGKPGMRKVRVTIYADGALPDGPRCANHPRSREPGARVIERASASTYSVHVVVPAEEEKRRRAASEIAGDDWRRRIRALPRPARLQPMPQAKWTSLEAARISAARDVRFQGVLARIVSAAGRPSV